MRDGGDKSEGGDISLGGGGTCNILNCDLTSDGRGRGKQKVSSLLKNGLFQYYFPPFAKAAAMRRNKNRNALMFHESKKWREIGARKHPLPEKKMNGLPRGGKKAWLV